MKILDISKQFNSKIVLVSLIFLYGSCKSADCGCPMAVEKRQQTIQKEENESSRMYDIRAVSWKQESTDIGASINDKLNKG